MGPASIMRESERITRGQLWALVAIVAVSGACSLAYQVAWLRLLRLVFGASTAASSAVVAIFMGGLGLGGYYLGRRAERSGTPLALYARLEIGVALSAAATPLLVLAVRAVYFATGGAVTEAAAGGAGTLALLLRLFGATLVLGLPTVLMGGTLPAAARVCEVDGDHGRRRVAWLYGSNTLGAVVGAVAATFVAIEAVGIRNTVWLAAAVNLLLALVARNLARQMGRAAKPEGAREDGESRELPSTASPAVASPAIVGRPGALAAVPRRWVLIAAVLVGFVFFLMEICWYRMLAPLLGGSSYTFGLILATALTGIGGGGLLYAWRPPRRLRGSDVLAVTCYLEAVCLLLAYVLGDRLALLAASLRGLGVYGFDGLVAGWAVVAVVVVLPTALVAGYQFPLLVALLGSGRRGVAVDVGAAYAWNTWGAVAGSLAGGFWLLPRLGAEHLWLGCGLLLLALAIALVATGGRQVARWRRLTAATVAALAVAWVGLAADGPTALWRHAAIGAGRFELEHVESRWWTATRNDRRRGVVAAGDGVESSVALVTDESLSLIVNGKSDGSAVGDAPTQVGCALVAGALHPAPRRVLVIGLGTGSTAGWFAAMDEVERVDVIELEPLVIAFASHFAAVNREVLDNPKVRILRGDGREYLMTTDERYDVIFSEPSNPYRAGVASLFSAEFYAAAAERLEPRGLFAQWLQAYEVDADVLRIAMATLGSGFPHIETWTTSPSDLLLIAAREAPELSRERIAARLSRSPFREGMVQVWGVEGLEGLLSGYLGGPELARALARGAPLSTDDRPEIEFGFVRNLGRLDTYLIGDLWTLSESLGATAPPPALAPDRERLDELRRVRALGSTLAAALAPPTGDLARRQRARQAFAGGEPATAAGLWQEQPSPPRAPVDFRLLAEGLAERGAAGWRPLATQLAAFSPPEAAFVAARAALRGGDPDTAARHLVAAIHGLRRHPWVDIGLVRRGLALGSEIVALRPSTGPSLVAALAAPWAGRLLDQWRVTQRAAMTAVGEPTPECVEVFGVFEPFPKWDGGFLAARAACYRRFAAPLADRAEEDLSRFVAQGPGEL